MKTGQAGGVLLGRELISKVKKNSKEKDISDPLRISGKCFPGGECLGQM